MKKQKTKDPKEKKSYLEWYKTRKPFKVSIAEMWLPLITLISCIFVMAFACEYFAGDALYLYSDDTYTYIMDNITNYTTSGENGGVQTRKLQDIVDKITLSYEKKTHMNILVCSIKNGFFKATVTAHLSENFDIGENTFIQNFNSFYEYKQFYWIFFNACTFGGGFILWATLVACYNIILWLISIIIQKKLDKASSKQVQSDEGNVKHEQPVSSLPGNQSLAEAYQSDIPVTTPQS